MKRSKWFIATVPTLAVLIACLCGCTQTSVTGVGLAPEIKAGSWFHAEQTPTLAELRGKIVLLQFFATDCPECMVPVMPHLNVLQSDWEDRDLVVIALTHEDPSVVKQFVHDRPVHFTVGAASSTAQKYGVTKIPYSVLIDRAGRIAWQGDPRSGLDLDEALERTYESN